ncbi:hypothetical protein ACTUVN_003951 [Pseudomonas caspiana]
MQAATLKQSFYHPAPIYQRLVHELSAPADTPVMIALGPVKARERLNANVRLLARFEAGSRCKTWLAGQLSGPAAGAVHTEIFLAIAVLHGCMLLFGIIKLVRKKLRVFV